MIILQSSGYVCCILLVAYVRSLVSEFMYVCNCKGFEYERHIISTYIAQKIARYLANTKRCVCNIMMENNMAVHHKTCIQIICGLDRKCNLLNFQTIPPLCFCYTCTHIYVYMHHLHYYAYSVCTYMLFILRAVKCLPLVRVRIG